jgi:hypothetical protein
LLARLWPWSFVAGLIAWLSLLPGTILLDYFFGVNDMDFVAPILTLLVLSAFGLLLLTVLADLRTTSRASSIRGRRIR